MGIEVNKHQNALIFQDKQQSCFKKYNATQSSTVIDVVKIKRHECAVSCFSPELFKIGRTNGKDLLCPLLEHKQEDDVSSKFICFSTSQKFV